MIKRILILLGLVTATGLGFTFDDGLDTSSMAWTNLFKGYNAVYNEFSGAYNVYSKKWDIDNKQHVFSQIMAGKNTVVPQLVEIRDTKLIPEFRITYIQKNDPCMTANKMVFSTGSQRAEFIYGLYQYWIGNWDANFGVTLATHLNQPDKLKAILSPSDPYLKVRLSYDTKGYVYEFNKAEREAIIDLLNLYEKLVAFDRKRKGM